MKSAWAAVRKGRSVRCSRPDVCGAELGRVDDEGGKAIFKFRPGYVPTNDGSWRMSKGAKTRERLFGSPSRRQAPGYEGPDLERAEVSLAPTVLPVDCVCHRCGLRQEVDPEAIDVAATLPMADTTLRFGVAKRCGWW